MAKPRFELSWRLEVTGEDGDRLAAALEPETDDHADLISSEEALLATGEGSAGESLHTLDDLLACLTAALETDDVS